MTKKSRPTSSKKKQKKATKKKKLSLNPALVRKLTSEEMSQAGGFAGTWTWGCPACAGIACIMVDPSDPTKGTMA